MNRGRREQLMEEILAAEARLHRLSVTAEAHPWLDMDLTMSQLKTLVLLYCAEEGGSGGLRISDLARLLGVTPATASTLVDRLVERGLVERREDPHDRRQHRCSVTPPGRGLLEHLSEGMRVRTRRLLQMLTEEELEMLLRSIEALLRAAERAAADAPRIQPPATTGR